MAEYIDAELLMQKLSRMIDYCEKNKDKKFNALNVLFQVGDAIMDCPTADVVPKSEVARLQEDVDCLQEINNRQVENIKLAEQRVAREIFKEIERKVKASIVVHLEEINKEHIQDTPLYDWHSGIIFALRGIDDFIAELKKKYQEGEPNG